MKFAAGLVLTIGLFCASAPAWAQNANLEEQLSEAYIIALQADRVTFVIAPEGLPAGSAPHSFQLTTYYAPGARMVENASAAWQDMDGVADCTGQQLTLRSLRVYDENGRQLINQQVNQNLSAEQASPLALAVNIACTSQRPQALSPSSRRSRLFAARTALAQRAENNAARE